MVALVVAGMSYGALIAAYPAAVVVAAGPDAAPRIYGQVFIAWGVAGLCAPWLAGYLFDRHESYELAIGVACLLALASVNIAWLLGNRIHQPARNHTA